MRKIAQSDNGTPRTNERSQRQERGSQRRKKAGGIIAKIIKELLKKFPIPTLIAIGVTIFIIYLVGVIGFLTTMPGLVLGKIGEIGKNLWKKICVWFAGGDVSRYVENEDILDLAQYLENMGYDIQSYGFGIAEYETTATGEVTSNKTVKEIKENADEKMYLKEYLVANNSTFSLATWSFADMLQSIWDTTGRSTWQLSEGMIDIVDGQMRNNATIDPDNETLTISYSTDISSEYHFDLSTWTARYGKPTELCLALHLSTMMPDLVSTIITDDNFNTKVTIDSETLQVESFSDIEAVKNGEKLDKNKIIQYFMDYCYTGTSTDFGTALSQTGNLNSNDNRIPRSQWTYNEVIELAQLLNQPLADDVSFKWPYITKVMGHWYYEDIDFAGTAYRVARNGTKRVNYYPEDENSALNKSSISIYLTLQLGTGVIYQVSEPEYYGPNEHIKEVFSQKYYQYNGTMDRARRIENARASENNSSSYYFNGETYSTESGQADSVEKQKVSFQDKDKSIAAFAMLENMHTEAGDYIYRNLKELVVKLKYFDKEELTDELTNVLLWPIETDNKNKTWETTKDVNEYGTKVLCDGGDTILSPNAATVEKIDGDAITLKIDKIDDDTMELLEYIYQGAYKSISPDVVTGLEFTIKGINISGDVSEGSSVTRGQTIGTAQIRTDEQSYIIILIKDYNQAVIEDINTYVRQSQNNKYEEIMRERMERGEALGAAIDLTRINYYSFSGGGSMPNDAETRQRAQFIWEYLKNKGWDDIHIAGVMGNMSAESGFRGDNVNNNAPYTDEQYTSMVKSGAISRATFASDPWAYGLIQWLDSRKGALYDYVKQKNGNLGMIDDIETQLEFLLVEHDRLQEYLNNTYSSPEDAAYGFEAIVERSGGSRLDVRQADARTCYTMFAGSGTGHTNPPGGNNVTV